MALSTVSELEKHDDLEFMDQALALAKTAAANGEVPVGALIVHNGEILTSACNTKEASTCPTHHAELLAIEAAAKSLGRWRLSDCDLYVTLEPCLMCAGAIVQARLRRVIYGTPDPKGGAVESLYQTLTDARLNHRPQVTRGVRADESAEILRSFFQGRRAEKSLGLGQQSF